MTVPLVSILIPAYNMERYIAETLRSAMAQTCQAKEIIVIDDGSRDNTLAIARTFEATNVKIVAQENRGGCAARNRAFNECQGEFIQHLDADDLLSPDKIELQMGRLAEGQPGSVASCAWGRFYDAPANTRFIPEPAWGDMSGVEWLVCSWRGGGMMHPGAWLSPRAICQAAGPWDESIPRNPNDDGEFFARVLLASKGVLFVPSARTYYRSGMPNSTSTVRSPLVWDSLYRSLKSATTQLLRAENSARTRQACADCLQRYVYEAYPNVPSIVKEAEDRVRELGGSQLKCGGGRMFKMVSLLSGWKSARRLQRIRQRLWQRKK